MWHTSWAVTWWVFASEAGLLYTEAKNPMVMVLSLERYTSVPEFCGSCA